MGISPPPEAECRDQFDFDARPRSGEVVFYG